MRHRGPLPKVTPPFSERRPARDGRAGGRRTRKALLGGRAGPGLGRITRESGAHRTRSRRHTATATAPGTFAPAPQARRNRPGPPGRAAGGAGSPARRSGQWPLPRLRRLQEGTDRLAGSPEPASWPRSHRGVARGARRGRRHRPQRGGQPPEPLACLAALGHSPAGPPPPCGSRPGPAGRREAAPPHPPHPTRPRVLPRSSGYAVGGGPDGGPVSRGRGPEGGLGEPLANAGLGVHCRRGGGCSRSRRTRGWLPTACRDDGLPGGDGTPRGDHPVRAQPPSAAARRSPRWRPRSRPTASASRSWWTGTG